MVVQSDDCVYSEVHVIVVCISQISPVQKQPERCEVTTSSGLNPGYRYSSRTSIVKHGWLTVQRNFQTHVMSDRHRVWAQGNRTKVLWVWVSFLLSVLLTEQAVTKLQSENPATSDLILCHQTGLGCLRGWAPLLEVTRRKFSTSCLWCWRLIDRWMQYYWWLLI